LGEVIEFFAEGDGGRFVGDEGVWSEFHEEAIGFFGPDDASESAGAFEECDVAIGLEREQSVCGSEPGDTATDHGDPCGALVGGA
jgi:hypothetical protein